MLWTRWRRLNDGMVQELRRSKEKKEKQRLNWKIIFCISCVVYCLFFFQQLEPSQTIEKDPLLLNGTTTTLKSYQDRYIGINAWGTPFKLTSFDYKWRDSQCPTNVPSAVAGGNNHTATTKKKRRIALCLFGGISPLTSKFDNTSASGDPDASDLSNVDWVAAMYDRYLFPPGSDDGSDDEMLIDVFLHTWSTKYYCTIIKHFDNIKRFTVRSVIAESNYRHMTELIPFMDKVLTNAGRYPTEEKHASMFFSINKALALALDYSANCGFEYDVLYVSRPDISLGKTVGFFDQGNGQNTSLQRVLPPYNEVLYSSWPDQFCDFHFIFNPTTARVFVHNMYPPPTEAWPDLVKMEKRLSHHTGFTQEFAKNRDVVMKEDGFIWCGKDERVIRTNFDRGWLEERLEMLGLPAHCFPSKEHGWKDHVESNDTTCFPTYYPPSSCKPNQN